MATRYRRLFVVVLDSVGIGALPDAEAFGDAGANTLGHIAERVGLFVPNLAALGLGNIAPLSGIPPAERPRAHFGRMAEVSRGKDTTIGHWELMGLRTDTPFPTYPNGFPEELLRAFADATGRSVLGNVPASGTEIIARLGEEHLRTGAWIVYTSADSVFQIAAHEAVVPLSELYRACETALALTRSRPDWAVARVIARPFVGAPGAFERTPNRRDFSVEPHGETVLVRLKAAGYDVVGVGKIGDIFAGVGLTESHPTRSNDDGVDVTLRMIARSDLKGLILTNLVDFDSKYGHRRDPAGYKAALEAFDRRLPELLQALRPGDLFILTADHGNDPTFRGTDHTREYVPLLVYDPTAEAKGVVGRPLGTRETFADVAQTIAENFSVGPMPLGTSFLGEIAA
ncbi:MAG: phosphopentomutase [Hydrogenibacillus schlegelii]|uniref:Phosphopentomutase n=1 Tax=Hydrogenibacillus schlegelii TaxID=1484 RepID=A0A947CZ73_HYDSH|nr:phosphopentomutase [Hydrogenibacillus schlegelii]